MCSSDLFGLGAGGNRGIGLPQSAFDRSDVHAGNCRQLGRLQPGLRAQSNHPLPERVPPLGPKFACVDLVHP